MKSKKNGDLINVAHQDDLDEVEAARLERAKARVEAQPKKKAPDVKVEEKNGLAVATIDVPAHTAEVPLAQSKVDGVISATVEAWHKVKGNDDAEFAACVAAFRQDLINHAEEVFRSGIVTEGDTVMARFEREVSNIKLREDDKKANAKGA